MQINIPVPVVIVPALVILPIWLVWKIWKG